MLKPGRQRSTFDYGCDRERRSGGTSKFRSSPLQDGTPAVMLAGADGGAHQKGG